VAPIVSPRKEKLSRLRLGAAPRVLDLFAGCGGLSLGFHAAGFEMVAAVENDSLAAKSHAINFFRQLPEEAQALHAKPRDITLVAPQDLAAELHLGQSAENWVDVIIGGPPCQAFARVGRAKLREVAAHPEAYQRDPRADLYLSYLRYVSALQPLALLVENVPDSLNYGGKNIPEAMCEALSRMGYVCRYSILNAAHYGVPQMRERVFLVALAQELGVEPAFPLPTHWIKLPRGYEGSRRVALRSVQEDLFSGSGSYYVSPPPASSDLTPAITVKEALGDLPRITLHLRGGLKRGARRFDTKLPYPRSSTARPYSALMRTWPRFENVEGVADHVIRSLPRDYPIFRRMEPGDEYPQAYRLALRLFDEALMRSARRGKEIKQGTKAYELLKRQIVPPYDPTKFPNKWRKMEANRPARTLMAHLGKDSYSHIHYSDSQARTISVREAARLQSFPDGFIFAGTMNPAFRQIGNAVPPLLANAVAYSILKTLGITVGTPPLAERLGEPTRLRR
jgi:DNA (cytosine-5)-methyltransferase 1